jgi:ATP-dependent exoDNAse (exonuclease V) beta subunit
MPEIRREPYRYFEEEEEDREPLSPTVYGTLVHHVLQNIRTPGSLTRLSAFIEEAVASQGLSDGTDVREMVGRIRHEVAAFCSSAIGARALNADEIFTEYRLDGHLESDFITGTIDRLVRIGKVWEVIDYKTDRMSNADPFSKNEAYHYQMMVYAWLVSRFTDQEGVPVSLFFTDQPSVSSTTVITRREIGQFEGEMQRIIGDIRERKIPKNVVHCPECSYSREGVCIQE